MTRWSLAALGAGAYMLALAALAPATLVDERLAAATEGRLRLVAAQGTIWSGSGALEARDAKRRPVIAKEVAWRVAPIALLRGAIEAELRSSDFAKPASLVATRDRIELTHAQLTLPAAALAALAPKLAPLQPTGTVDVTLDRVAVAGRDVSGSGVARWQPAGSALSTLYPLGAYELRVDASGADRRAALRTLAGPLRLEGGGSWNAGSAPRLEVTAEVPPAQRESLSPLLRLIARDRGDGRFELVLN